MTTETTNTDAREFDGAIHDQADARAGANRTGERVFRIDLTYTRGTAASQTTLILTQAAAAALRQALDAYLPAHYVPAEGHRLDLYRRLSTCRDLDRIAEIQAELEDRFGPMPDEAAQLIRVLRFRVLCQQRGIASITEDAGALQMRVRLGQQITKGSQAQLKKYGLRNLRRTIRALSVRDLWVSVTFTNVPASARLTALEDIAELIATETRPTRVAS